MPARLIVAAAFALLGIVGLGVVGLMITSYIAEENHDSGLLALVPAMVMFGVAGALFLGLGIALSRKSKSAR